MPELPEVEVTRLSFADRIAGAEILDLEMGKALRWPLGCAPQLLVGQTVLGVRRRGKYLLLDLSGGLLLMHLGMSGSLTFAQTAPPAGKHDHFDLITSHGVLRLHDPRRFGAAVYADSEQSPQAQKLLGGLGMEPLSSSFDPQIFYAQLRLRNAPTKLMKNLGYGEGYRYAHDEAGGFAAGESYFPDDMKAQRFYEPVDRGMEAKIKEKLDALRERNKK